MMIRRSTPILLASLLSLGFGLGACGEPPAKKPAVAKADAKADAKTPAKADAKTPAKTDAEAKDDNDGCIYKDAHAKKEPHDCGGDAGAPSDDADGHFGAPFELTETQALGAVLASATAPTGAVQVSGEIDKVCQKMGCWMVVRDGEQTARIMMKDHSFTVPKKSTGKNAVIEGVLTTRTFEEKEVKHLEKDAGGDPSKVSGERKEHVLTATGIKISQKNS